MIRVVIADDQELVLSGFSALVSAAAGLTVVGEASNGVAAVEQCERARPDVVLMDIRMPEMDGLEATRRITASPALLSTRVLILTTFDIDDYVYEALRAGASGFLLKDTAPAQLLDAIRIVAAGDALIAPSITRRLIEEFADRRDPSANAEQLSGLTERELEVLVEVARGRSNDEMARTLTISPLTAKTHVSRILSKLSARDRAQLVAIAYETGLVVPGAD